MTDTTIGKKDAADYTYQDGELTYFDGNIYRGYLPLNAINKIYIEVVKLSRMVERRS